ncbi:MAG: anthranilate synthase component I family protein [Gemmatimonadota bacterium]
MSFERFLAIAGDADLVPIWRDILLDTDTAVSAFARIRRGPFAFLLESAPAGGETWARYTFIGTEPREAWKVTGRMIERWLPATGWRNEGQSEDPMADFSARLRALKPAQVPGLGDFWSGAVGFFSYDAARLLERLPHAPPRWSSMPDALFLFTRSLVIIDNLRGTARLVVSVVITDEIRRGGAATLRSAYNDAASVLDDIEARLSGPSPLPRLSIPDVSPAPDSPAGTSSISRSDFMQHVERIREHIFAGDCFQVLLARRISLEADFEPATLYRILRSLNPSPYMFHLVLDGIELVGSSPELLVRVSDGTVTVRPIAGTRRRTGSASGDAAMERELLADEKERAEHLMLVDLGRNDVGRVAQAGSVEVTALMNVERYSHLLHIVSEVRGRLRPGLSALDAFKATFPAGTMTGAPKIRAMQIIDEIEPENRGPYAGAVGYISHDDARMDLAITIRTCIIADGVASVQAGAGIVADSDPGREWDETETKARALLSAIGLARTSRVLPT